MARRSTHRRSAAMALGLLTAGSACFAALQHGFFAVHCEPLIADEPLKIGGGMNLRRPEAYWDALSNLVVLAESHGHCLTIMFTPQWAVYAAARPARRLQVAEWTAAGHELAVHHHGREAIEHGNDWDGFSNDEILLLSTNAFGDIPFMMNQGIYTDYPLLSATTEDGDWPEGVRYSAAGGATDYTNLLALGDLVSSATPAAMAGLSGTSPQQMGVWTFRMRHFTTAAIQTDVLEETESALVDCAGLASNEYVLGYVTHAKNFHDTGVLGHYDELFAMLTNAGVRLIAVSNLAAELSLGTPVPPPQAGLAATSSLLEIDWDTTADGLTYQLQHSDSLVTPNWTNWSPPTLGDGSNHCETIGTVTDALSFFRVTVSE